MIRLRHLAVLLPTLNAGGAERAMTRLAGAIAEQGYRVDLVLVQATGPFLAEVPEGVRIVDLQGRRAITSLSKLIKYLRRERPDTLLSALDYVNILAVCATKLARVPIRLVISQRIILSLRAKFMRSAKTWFIPALARRFYPWADEIVAVSQGVADDLIENSGISSSQIRVIYNLIDTTEIAALAEEPVDHEWFSDKTIPVVLAVGRLVEQKGFSTLISAFAKVVQKCEARLVILGEGELRSELEDQIRSYRLNNVVSLPGFVANPYPYMASAAVVVLSSKFEGLPGVVIEAMACGSPVVATDCPGGPSEVLNQGKHGRLVPIGDDNAMAQAIELSIKHGPVPLPGSLEPFQPDRIVKQYLEVLFEEKADF